jgi:CheY-like chemotaxis protein
MEKKKILIVDDNVEFLEELEDVLKSAGYEVVLCSSGNGAVECAKNEMPELILLDLKLDGKTGFEVADELSRGPETREIPIVSMTGHYTEKEYRLLMNVSGMKECLLKPFNPLDVIARIEHWTEDNAV